MISDRQRNIVIKFWPPEYGPTPSDAAIERAYDRWEREAERDGCMSDFYFSFPFTLASYNPACWIDLFKDDYKEKV